jgi:hypothetical protein
MTYADRLAELEPACTLDEALALYDDLPAVASAEVLGSWKGRELKTGHPMDGLLEASGWWGKRFDSIDAVHPLLFSDGSGDIFPVDPRKVPLGLADRIPAAAVERGRRMMPVLRHVVGTSKPRARLRDVEHRGKVSAAMVYDHLPIIDHFRAVDDTTLLGVMDLRGAPPYAFLLTRA